MSSPRMKAASAVVVLGGATAGTAYAAGDRVTYNGVTYQCRQAHTALAGWEPPDTAALWQRM